MFNVGDKVRRLHDGYTPLRGISRAVGTISTVSEVSYTGAWMGLVGQDQDGHDPVPFAIKAYELVKSDKVPHVHAGVIKAWADGATIQFLAPSKTAKWEDVANPAWYEDYKYRVKPEPKPDVVRYARASFTEYDPNLPAGNALKTETYWTSHKSGSDNIKAVWDGETGVLKTVEIIK